MRIHFLIPCIGLSGCWLSGAELRDKQGLGTAVDTADSDTDPSTTTTETGSTTTDTTETTTPGGTTTTPTGTTTEPPLGCVDQDLGSAVGLDLATGTTVGAGDDFAPDCEGASLTGGEDVAIAWTAPTTGCWSFRTAGSSFDTVAYVLDGCEGAELACNDDYNDAIGSSEAAVSLGAGAEVVVVIDGFEAAATGTWWLDVAAGTEIVADLDIGSAVGAGAAVGSTSGADTSMIPPMCEYLSGRDLLIRWVAPTSDVWTFSLDPLTTTFDSSLALLRQCGVDAYTCEDIFVPGVGGGEQVTALVYAGEEVFVRVAGYDDGTGAESGNFRLDIQN